MQDFCGGSFSCCGALVLCALLALAGPLLDDRITRRRELFLLAMGILAATLSWAWNWQLLTQAFIRPLKFCAVMASCALAFAVLQESLGQWAARASARFGLRACSAAAVGVCGLLSPVLTCPVAAWCLIEILNALRLSRKALLQAAVLGCMSVALGGALSSVGSPVTAVFMSKLVSAPYPLGRLFLLDLVGALALPAVAALSLTAAYLCGEAETSPATAAAMEPMNLWAILVETGSYGASIIGLVLLGAGLVPAIDRLLLFTSPALLFWVNAAAAVLDPATLAAVELSPRMSQEHLRLILMSLLAASGALAGGAAHNRVIARKLNISDQEWARAGLPVCAVVMAAVFASYLISRFAT